MFCGPIMQGKANTDAESKRLIFWNSILFLLKFRYPVMAVSPCMFINQNSWDFFIRNSGRSWTEWIFLACLVAIVDNQWRFALFSLTLKLVGSSCFTGWWWEVSRARELLVVGWLGAGSACCPVKSHWLFEQLLVALSFIVNNLRSGIWFWDVGVMCKHWYWRNEIALELPKSSFFSFSFWGYGLVFSCILLIVALQSKTQ